MIINHNPPPERKEELVDNYKRDRLTTFTWNGNTFKIDLTSLLLIIGQTTAMLLLKDLGQPVSDVSWRTADKQTVTFAPSEFAQFALAASQYVRQVYQDAWQYEDLVP